MPPVLIIRKDQIENVAGAATWTPEEADDALLKLLDATLTKERIIAMRDTQVAQIQRKHVVSIAAATADANILEDQLELYYRAHPPVEGKHIKLAHGTIGMRTASQASLVPLSDKWTWEKISAKIRRSFKAHYFHPPKPAALDKNKVKKELTEEQLEKHGLKLEERESFYIDMPRLELAA